MFPLPINLMIHYLLSIYAQNYNSRIYHVSGEIFFFINESIRLTNDLIESGKDLLRWGIIEFGTVEYIFISDRHLCKTKRNLFRNSFWRKKKLQPRSSQNIYNSSSGLVRFGEVRKKRKRSKMTSCPVWYPYQTSVTIIIKSRQIPIG